MIFVSTLAAPFLDSAYKWQSIATRLNVLPSLHSKKSQHHQEKLLLSLTSDHGIGQLDNHQTACETAERPPSVASSKVKVSDVDVPLLCKSSL